MSQYAHPSPPDASPPGPAAMSAPGLANGQGQHKRVYQACIPCRRRKVRCDLGSVDNPHDPPCVRCRRESKECYFSATRRKRKTDDGASNDDDEYTIRNGRKRLRASEPGSPPLSQVDRRLYSDVPLTPGGSLGRSQPLRRPNDHGADAASVALSGAPRRRDFGVDGEPNTTLENFEARSVMRREVYGPHDALDLLYKAATDRSVRCMPADRNNAIPLLPPADRDTCSPSKHDATTAAHRPHSQRTGPPRSSIAHTQESDTGKLSHAGSGLYDARHDMAADGPTDADQPIDPELTRRDITAEPGYADALKAWARFRFVRAGWFTAQEAIEYVE